MVTVKLKFAGSRSRQQGLAVVEFVIVLPLIILLALAVTELGRGLYQYNTLTKSVQDGVRYLADRAIDGSGQLLITEELDGNTKKLVISGRTGGGTPLLPTDEDTAPPVVTVEPIDVYLPGMEVYGGGSISPNHVKVTATYNFSPLFSLGRLGYDQVIPQFRVSAIGRVSRL